MFERLQRGLNTLDKKIKQTLHTPTRPDYRSSYHNLTTEDDIQAQQLKEQQLRDQAEQERLRALAQQEEERANLEAIAARERIGPPTPSRGSWFDRPKQLFGTAGDKIRAADAFLVKTAPARKQRIHQDLGMVAGFAGRMKDNMVSRFPSKTEPAIINGGRYEAVPVTDGPARPRLLPGEWVREPGVGEPPRVAAPEVIPERQPVIEQRRFRNRRTAASVGLALLAAAGLGALAWYAKDNRPGEPVANAVEAPRTPTSPATTVEPTLVPATATPDTSASVPKPGEASGTEIPTINGRILGPNFQATTVEGDKSLAGKLPSAESLLADERRPLYSYTDTNGEEHTVQWADSIDAVGKAQYFYTIEQIAATGGSFGGNVETYSPFQPDGQTIFERYRDNDPEGYLRKTKAIVHGLLWETEQSNALYRNHQWVVFSQNPEGTSLSGARILDHLIPNDRTTAPEIIRDFPVRVVEPKNLEGVRQLISHYDDEERQAQIIANLKDRNPVIIVAAQSPR